MAQLINILENEELIKNFKDHGSLTYNVLQTYFRETTYGQRALCVGKDIIYDNTMYDNHYKINNEKERLSMEEMLIKLNELFKNNLNDFNKKLSGLLPVTREELIYLINSWGRKDEFETYKTNALKNTDFIDIYACKPKECYPLNKLDVSQINDLSFVFKNSLFNDDISSWDVSNCNKFINMFMNSDFDGNISSWKFNKDANLSSMFIQNNNFKKKYNNGKSIPSDSDEFKDWFKNNMENFKEVIEYGKYVDIKSNEYNKLSTDDKIKTLNKNINILNKYLNDNNELLKEQKLKYKENKDLDENTKLNIITQFEKKCMETNEINNKSINKNKIELEKQKHLKKIDTYNIDFEIFKKPIEELTKNYYNENSFAQESFEKAQKLTEQDYEDFRR